MKAQISLHSSAGWSGPALSADYIRAFSWHYCSHVGILDILSAALLNWSCYQRYDTSSYKTWRNLSLISEIMMKQHLPFPLSGLFQQTTNWWCLSYFSPKTGFDISCKLSPVETICMKFQILFFCKNKNNISKYCHLKVLPRMLSINSFSATGNNNRLLQTG